MTKGERREAKANKRHGAMRMAGGSLRVVYAAAVLKRAGFQVVVSGHRGR